MRADTPFQLPNHSSKLSRLLAIFPRSLRELKREASLLAALADLGWHRSVRLARPVDRAANPVPWFTYPAILWLGTHLRSTDSVFEYGAGNSTLWFAARVASVLSVENDPSWCRELVTRAPSNATIMYRPCLGGHAQAPRHDPFVRSIETVPHQLDIVVVDGPARVACVHAAIPYIKNDGILILDNSDRPEYSQALDLLHTTGFGRIDFLGPVPGSGRLSCTSMFSREWHDRLHTYAPLPHLDY